MGLPVSPLLVLPGWPGVVGGTPRPSGSGMSLLGSPSVSRGSENTRPGTLSGGWEVVKHPVAVLFQSWDPKPVCLLPPFRLLLWFSFE